MERSVAQPTFEQREQGFDHYLRAYNDAATWSAETLNGSMRSSFEYHYDGIDLRAEDGGALGEVFDDAIRAAHLIVRSNPQLLFELRRRFIEREEYSVMLAMAQGEGPNTMVVESDFPPELMDAPEDVGGYNVRRKQTMLRIITRVGRSTLRMTTQSLDGSNRKALEVVYAQINGGQVPQPGELLGQRTYLTLSPEQQAELTDELTQAYDTSLTDQFGGNWHAGIPRQAHSIDTYDFAHRQHDLLHWFSRAVVENPAYAEKLRYKLGATMGARYKRAQVDLRGLEPLTPSMLLHNVAYDQNSLWAEIEQASYRAASAGEVFSGCGASAHAEQSSAEAQLEQAGYGNKSDEATTYSFNKKMHCVVCQAPPKNGEPKKLCGPCGICRSCDHKLGGKG